MHQQNKGLKGKMMIAIITIIGASVLGFGVYHSDASELDFTTTKKEEKQSEEMETFIVDESLMNNQQKNKQEEQNKETEVNNFDIHQAIDVALDNFTGTVTEIELDNDDGRYTYEIELESGNEEAEIEIDAHTNEVLGIEIDD